MRDTTGKQGKRSGSSGARSRDLRIKRPWVFAHFASGFLGRIARALATRNPTAYQPSEVRYRAHEFVGLPQRTYGGAS